MILCLAKGQNAKVADIFLLLILHHSQDVKLIPQEFQKEFLTAKKTITGIDPLTKAIDIHR